MSTESKGLSALTTKMVMSSERLTGVEVRMGEPAVDKDEVYKWQFIN